MSRYYRRVEKGSRTSVQAGLVAGGVATLAGALSYYLVRLFLSREPLDPLTTEPLEEGTETRKTDGE